MPSPTEPTTREAVREWFLDFMSDCTLTIEYDADTTSTGTTINCSTFTISGPIEALDNLTNYLVIKPYPDESLEDAIQRYTDLATIADGNLSVQTK